MQTAIGQVILNWKLHSTVFLAKLCELHAGEWVVTDDLSSSRSHYLSSVYQLEECE